MNPSISLATVYKTLDSFRKVGLIQEINVGDDKSRYDAKCEEHIHIVCTTCNNVFDVFEIDSLHMIKEEVIQKTDFSIDFHQAILYGTCSACQNEDD